MKTREELEALGIRILREMRTQLCLSVRVMGPALDALDYGIDLRTRTIGTDAESIRFNPRYLTEEFLGHPRRLLRCYMHMLLHCLFRHPFHREDAEDPELYDLCTDIAVESVLDTMREPELEAIPTSFREEWIRRLREEAGALSAEVLMKYFAEHRPDPDTREQLEREFRRDDHQFWKRKDPDRDPPDPASGPMRSREDDWRERAKNTKEMLTVQGNEASDEQGGLSWMLSATDEAKTDYRVFLRKLSAVREEVRIDPDGFDAGYYHLGLELYGNVPLIEENELRETVGIDQLVIAIDTSASTKPVLVQRFLNETAAILASQETFFHRVEIHLIECDNRVQRDLVLTDVKDLEKIGRQFEVRGGMGTDFRPVFAWVQELRRKGKLPNLRGLLYFTDGFGTYPETAVPWETAFVFCPDAAYDDSKVPEWAIKLYTGKDFLRGENAPDGYTHG